MSENVKPRELHGKKLAGYSIGHFGLYLSRLLIIVFVFQFYVYTINLDALLTSIGISINLIFEAIFSIIFGVIADNKKPGKLGKRRPFLFYGLPIWFLTNIFIWLPPWKCPKTDAFYWPTAAYLWLILFLNSVSSSSILSAYLSMFPEQSQTLINRKKVASYRALLMIIASILTLLLPLIVQSILEDPERVKWWEPSGKVVLFFMPIIGLSFAIFGFFSIIMTFFSIDESFHKILPKYETKKLNISATFYQMGIPAKDKKYKKFLASSVLNAISARILGILIIPLLAYVLKFKGTDFFIYVAVSFVCKMGWFYLWKKILSKYDLVKSFYYCIALSAVVSFLELVFLISFLPFEVKIVMFIITIGTILGTVYGLNLFIDPITSAIVDEYATKKKEENPETVVTKISGSYFGLHSFMLAIGQGVASVMVGIILSGSNESNPTIITLSMASMGIFYVISLIYAKKIKLDIIDNKQY